MATHRLRFRPAISVAALLVALFGAQQAHAGFLVVKQAGVGLAGGKADEQAGHQGGQKAGEHQNSPE